MKPYEEWSFGEKVDYHSGQLIVAIGTGKFRETVCSVLMSVTQDAYNRGVKSVQPKTKKKPKPKC